MIALSAERTKEIAFSKNADISIYATLA